MGHSLLSTDQVTMPSVPVSVLLVLLLQTCTAAGEPRRLPSAAAFQLLRLERMRELIETIPEREEDETQNLEEMIKNVEKVKMKESQNGPLPLVTMRQNPLCLRRCLGAGILHPAQCHALC